MPVFHWEAVTKEGARRSGNLEAPSRESVLEELDRQGLLPIRVESKEAQKGRRISVRWGKIKRAEKIQLCQHLAVMIRAGIALNQALEILIADAENPALKRFFEDTRTIIQRGQPLWSAFAMYGETFPKYLVGLVRAGEASGRLSQAFDQAAAQLARDYESRRRAIAAMFYPAILLGMSTVLILFLFLFAIPKLAATIREITTNLPTFSRIVFRISDVISAHPIVIIGAILLVVVIFVVLATSRFGRRLLGILAWKFPLTRNFLKKFAIARFARTLGSLLKAGLPALEAVEITAGSLGIESVRLAVLDARERIRKGSSFTDAFRSHPEYFPNLLVGMMAVGEQSGQLSDLLLTVSRFFEDDADHSLQTLVSLIEPLMLLIMGGIVGGIAISVIIPIYQLISVVQ